LTKGKTYLPKHLTARTKGKNLQYFKWGFQADRKLNSLNYTASIN